MKALIKPKSKAKLVSKIKKGANGFTMEDPTLPKLQPFQQPIPSSLDLRIPGAQIPQQEEFPLVKKLDPFQVPIPSSKDLRTPGATINPNYKGQRPKDKKPYSPDLSNGIAAGLSLIDAAIPKGDMSRKYVRPEDQLSYNPLPYGTGSQAIMKKGGKMKKCAEGMTMPGLTGQFYARETGVKAKKFPDGGKQKGKQAPQPIVVNNPNDPRLRAYQDSLSLYKDNNWDYLNNPYGKNYTIPINKELSEFWKKGNNKPIKWSTPNNEYSVGHPVFKKPVQPVVYQKDPQLQKPSVTNVPLPQATGMQGAGIRPIPVPDMTQRPTNFTVDNHGTPQYFQSYDQWKNFVDKNNLSSKQEAGDKSSAQANYFAEGGPLKKGKKVTIMSYADGGGVTPLIGGKAPQISHNPIDGGMGEFQGRSHEDGGIKATFAGKPFEAEGGEPYRIDSQGSLEIFGQLKNPLTGSTFKKDAKVIAKKEQRVQKYIDLGTELVNNSPEQKDKFELLKFNSGQAMLRGGLGEQKKLAKEKENLSMMQRIMLQEESPEKAEHGGYYAEGGVVDPEKELKEQKEYYQNILKNPKKHYEWEVAQAKEFIKNPSSFYEGLIEYNNNQIKQGNKDSYLKDEINDYKEVLNYLKNPNKNKAKIKKVETPLQNSTNTQSTNLPKENTVSQELTPISPVGKPDPEIPLVDISMPSYLDKFETVKEKTKAALEAKYPGKKVEVKYNALGSARSAKQQQGIKANQKSPLSKDWSTHNWDAGRDYNIFIDGKLQNTTSPDYKVLHSIGSQEGLHYLKGNAAKKDPFHLSLVEEGGPNTAANLLKSYPELAQNPAVQDWVDEYYHSDSKSPIRTKNTEKAFFAAHDKEIWAKENTPLPAAELTIPKGQSIQGEGLYPTSNYWSPGNTGWSFNGTKKPTVPPTPHEDKPFNLVNPTDRPASDLKSPFPWEQTIPLIPALIDRTDPVKMQKFSPDLYSPYSVSFQDQRNRNTAQLRGVQTATAYDPTAQAVLGAQAYSANNQIDAEEFRTNQGIFNDVLNKNVSLLNAAKTANLQLGDTQYTRQTQAQANTRDRRTEGLVALTDLIAKNQLENKTLGVAKNLFKDYTFVKNGTIQYVDPTSGEQITGFPTITPTQKTKSEVSTKTGNTTTKDTYQPIQDFTGIIKKALRKPYKSGGKVTQNTIAKLMYS